MDAPYYNGADDRPWPSVDEVCQDCGAKASEPCTEECHCEDCEDADAQMALERSR